MSAEEAQDTAKTEAGEKPTEAPDPNKTLAEQVSQNELEMYRRTQDFISEIEEEVG